MGVTVRQKTKGKGMPWWVFFSHNGKRTSRKVGDKNAAEEVASTIRAKLQLGEFSFEDEKPVPTFKEYADSWIKATVPATCKESTTRGYTERLNNHGLPTFKSLNISEITRGTIKDFLLDKINDGYARNTVSHMKDVVSGVLNKALDDEIIPANPALSLGKVLPKRSVDKDINPLTFDELNHLLDIVQSYFQKHFTLFLLLSRTGMRIGEAIAVKWADIDFNSRFIQVRRSIVRGKESRLKSGKSRRVDMSLQLTKVLKAHRHLCKKKGLLGTW
jgi:integrase